MADIPRSPIYVKYWPYPWPQAEFYYRVSSVAILHSIKPPNREDDWPVPIRPYIVRAEARSAFIPLLHSIKPPNRLSDWPLPRRPSIVYAQSYPSPYALTTVVAVEQPFAQEDWPTPKQAHGKIEWIHTNLVLGQWQPLPYNQSDWPRPTPLPHREYSRPYSSPFSLVTFVVVNPFSQSNWPTPIQPYRVYAEARSAFRPLLHSVKSPINQQSWPLPIQPPRVYAQSYSARFPLLTEVAVTLIPPTFDYPTQRGQFVPFSETRSAFPPLLHSVYPPINQEAWPVPTPPYRVYADSYSSNFQLLTSIQPPNAQSDWPLPIQPPRVYARSYGMAPTILTPAAPPISESDWPVPVQPPRVYAEVRRADIQLLHSVKPPNAQLDWPLPKRVRPMGETWKRDGHSAIQLSVKPFVQLDWPNPKLPIQPTSARTWVQKSLDLITPQVPQRQRDWPTPHLQQTTKIRSQSYSSPPTLLTAPVLKPFKQDNWPVPQLYLYLHLYFSPEGWSGIFHGQAHITPPPTPTPEPQPELVAGYESQIGVWHPHSGRTGRVGKRYRIYSADGSSSTVVGEG